MKLIFSAFLCSISLVGMAQSIPQNGGSTLTQSAVSNSLTASAQAIKLQESKWQQQTLANPGDANAWLNYYTWLDRDKEKSGGEKKQAQNLSFETASKYIGQTWQFALLQFLQSNKRDSAALFTALNKAADKTVIYPYAIQFAIITNNKTLLSNYCSKMDNTSPLSAGLYEYHYNTLMSATPGATIYAKGLGDLAALAIVQKTHHIREDIHLQYYEGPVIDQDNAYLCLSVGKDILEAYPAAAYTGLLVKISGTVAVDELEMNLTQKFLLTNLKNTTSLSADEMLIYKNYLPSFILLYKHYTIINKIKAQEWKAMIDRVAQLTNSTDAINKILVQ